MSLLTDIGVYLDSQLASLTVGTNLFYGRLPDGPDTCVALIETGGQTPSSTMVNGKPLVLRPRIQVLTRAKAYADAESLASSVWGALEGLLDDNLSGTRYYNVTAIQSPFSLERDSQDRQVMAQNFQVVSA